VSSTALSCVVTGAEETCESEVCDDKESKREN
jgi:hypothetical protein